MSRQSYSCNIEKLRAAMSYKTSADIQGLGSDKCYIGIESRKDINDWCLLNQNEQKLDGPGRLKELECSTAKKN